MNEHIYSIPFCNNCDISIGCSFNPGKGRGSRNSVMYITSHQTASDYKRGMGNGRNSKLIKEYNDSYNLEAYYTSLVKCISRGIPTEFEINNCIDYLKNEILEVAPKIIVTIGDTVTSKFIDYTYFKYVVDKAHIVELNGIQTIIYPIYSVSYKNENLRNLYDKSFKNIAKMYVALINTNHFSFKLYTEP